jgi:hypothetical protein
MKAVIAQRDKAREIAAALEEALADLRPVLTEPTAQNPHDSLREAEARGRMIDVAAETLGRKLGSVWHGQCVARGLVGSVTVVRGERASTNFQRGRITARSIYDHGQPVTVELRVDMRKDK